ncbi:MAG: hypothetical protein H0W67_06525 [Gemmatimonadales bacterium]|nr:hypothetical protein [Gemmatimonadales bacterium]
MPLAGPASARPRSDLPDIYFIVLDAYTGGRSLKRNYQFDNAEFVSALQGRGFFVPRASRSNYTLTYLALAAALNWEYLEWLPALLGERSNDFAIPRAMIEDSRTQRFLKGLGYRVIFFPTAYGATARNRHADLLIPQGGQAHPRLRREFFSSWLRTTPLRPIFGWGCRLTRCRADPLPFNPESPELILWKFDQIGALARSPGPKFVFAHLLTPHEPYVFTANCTPKPLHWPSRMDRVEDRRIRVAYVEQIRCVNSNLLALVDRLQQQPLRPVIILQGDHGNGRFPFGRPQPLDVATPEQVAERADPFGAYYLPDGGNALLYDSISPVNVFPIVLRHYYGAQVQRLEDRTYYSSSRDPYRFTRIR